MKFSVPWRAQASEALGPEARETARQAARRSGMPLGDWLNAVILRQAPRQDRQAPTPGADDAYGEDLAGVNQRLDDLSRRIEQLTRTGPAAYAPRRGRSAPPPPSPPR